MQELITINKKAFERMVKEVINKQIEKSCPGHMDTLFKKTYSQEERIKVLERKIKELENETRK